MNVNESSLTPEAFYDSLSLANKLDSLLDGFKLEEIHLFSYFSSILFIYRGNPLSEWCYKFIRQSDYPFSSELNFAIDRHKQNGLFDQDGDFFRMTSRGTNEFNKFKNLETFKKREIYLATASDTTILVPYTLTRRALLNDPELEKAKTIGGEKWLDQPNSYRKFKEISDAVGIQSDELIIPAISWIYYIDKEQRQEAFYG